MLQLQSRVCNFTLTTAILSLFQNGELLSPSAYIDRAYVFHRCELHIEAYQIELGIRRATEANDTYVWIISLFRHKISLFESDIYFVKYNPITSGNSP